MAVDPWLVMAGTSPAMTVAGQNEKRRNAHIAIAVLLVYKPSPDRRRRCRERRRPEHRTKF
jgi:hypothetical protein